MTDEQVAGLTDEEDSPLLPNADKKSAKALGKRGLFKPKEENLFEVFKANFLKKHKFPDDGKVTLTAELGRDWSNKSVDLQLTIEISICDANDVPLTSDELAGYKQRLCQDLGSAKNKFPIVVSERTEYRMQLLSIVLTGRDSIKDFLSGYEIVMPDDPSAFQNAMRRSGFCGHDVYHIPINGNDPEYSTVRPVVNVSADDDCVGCCILS